MPGEDLGWSLMPKCLKEHRGIGLASKSRAVLPQNQIRAPNKYAVGYTVKSTSNQFINDNAILLLK